MILTHSTSHSPCEIAETAYNPSLFADQNRCLKKIIWRYVCFFPQINRVPSLQKVKPRWHWPIRLKALSQLEPCNLYQFLIIHFFILFIIYISYIIYYLALFNIGSVQSDWLHFLNWNLAIYINFIRCKYHFMSNSFNLGTKFCNWCAFLWVKFV